MLDVGAEVKMRGSQRLHKLRSRGWYNYVSSTSLGFFIGINGVEMAGTATQQTDEGQNMKQAFLEEWEYCPQSWDPRDLMDFPRCARVSMQLQCATGPPGGVAENRYNSCTDLAIPFQ